MTFNSEPQTKVELSSFIHQAALDPHLSLDFFNELCDASKYLNLAGFCTSLSQTSAARKRIGTSNQPKLITVIGFPFGNVPNKLKISEAEYAAEEGADELDIVPNFFALNDGQTAVFAEELSEICEIGLPSRVILDVTKLSLEKLSLAIDASIDAGVRGIQTGNGFGPKASTNIIQQLRPLTKGRCSIKAVGGINNCNDVLRLIEAGATEIGTSHGPQIIKEFLQDQT